MALFLVFEERRASVFCVVGTRVGRRCLFHMLSRVYREPRCLPVLNCHRVLLDVEASLNEGALTLVNAGQPCLRIIFDLKAELQKKKTDWRLELGLGALQAFGLAGEV